MITGSTYPERGTPVTVLAAWCGKTNPDLPPRRSVAAMRESSPRRCGLSWCGSTDGVRHFLPGLRCVAHTPAALAGEPEPDVLAARVRAQRETYRAQQLAAVRGEAA